MRDTRHNVQRTSSVQHATAASFLPRSPPCATVSTHAHEAHNTRCAIGMPASGCRRRQRACRRCARGGAAPRVGRQRRRRLRRRQGDGAVQMFLPVPDTEWLDGAYVAYLYNLTQAAAPPHTRLARPTPALALPPPVPVPVPSPYRALPCPLFYSAPLAPTALRPWSSPKPSCLPFTSRFRSAGLGSTPSAAFGIRNSIDFA